MEKSKKTVLLRGDFPWLDIGTWKSIEEIHPKDKNNNVAPKNTLQLNSKNNIVISEKPIALCGVDDLIVVDTKDAVLICNKDSAQDVKKLVHSIKNKKLL